MSSLLDIPETDIERELARRNLLAFVLHTYPGYSAGWFHREVCERLDRFLDDVLHQRSPRLMLFAPPRHGKSELVSRRFPAFALGRHPDLAFIATSYGADLASQMNRDVQRIIDTEEYASVFPGTRLYGENIRTTSQGAYLRNSDIFEVVGHKGVYRSAGVGGGITGRGADILTVDDPVKDEEQAESKVYRDKVWGWFRSTAYTRLSPGGGVLIILTRWHEDDLAGRLLKEAQHGGEEWEVVSYPAIAERDEAHRKDGEALHEARYSREALVGEDGNGGIKRAVGTRVWGSLYQQHPTTAEGALFKREHWRSFKMPEFSDPRELMGILGLTRIVQAWDTAHKDGEENDYWACCTIGVAPNRYLILDVLKRKMQFPEGKRTLVAMHAKWQPDVVVIEEKASGLDLIPELRRDTRIPVHPVPANRDKVARANTVTPTHEAGLVYLPEGAEWTIDFTDSCASFPNAAHDDDVDAFVHALAYVTRGGGALGMLEWAKQQAKQVEQRQLQEAAVREGRVLPWPIPMPSR